MAEFYSARSWEIPPLPWTNLSPPFSKQTEQGRQPRETAVAILNVGGGDDAVQQQALRIDQNRPLLALDQLAGIEAVAVDVSPPFSALFTP